MRKLLVVVMMIVGLFGLSTLATQPVLAATCGDGTPEGAIECGNLPKPKEEKLIATVLNYVYLVAGIIAVIVLIYAGIQYSISGGDPGKLSTAKNTIQYTIIGLIVVLLAFAITNFVIGAIG